MTKTTKKNEYLAARYPILKNVAPAERQRYVRRAVLHPIVLVFAFLLGGVILPTSLEYLLKVLNIEQQTADTFTLIKIFFIFAIPFGLVFIFLNKCLLPYCLKRILTNEGYFSNKSDK